MAIKGRSTDMGVKKQYKPLALGVDDFRFIIENDCYYVDKSMFIAELLDKKGVQVKLITRPRRFGKTLNMSMLHYFFDVEGAEKNRYLFSGLEIENSPHMEHFGGYPVIFMTLKATDSLDYHELMVKLRDRIKDLFRKYQFLCTSPNLSKIDLYDYHDIVRGKKENITDALQYLSGLLHKHYDKNVIILLDEYDSPIIDSYTSGYYNEAIKFFRNFMSSTFKTNPHLESAVLTGVSRISKESIFSGMNNVQVYSVISDGFATSFGFTQYEVSKALSDYNYAEKEEDVKSYYDGYHFGNKGLGSTDIYNPLSILKFLEYGNLDPYWVNTASDNLIKNTAVKTAGRFLEVCEQLLQGYSVEAEIDEGITFQRLDGVDDLWTLLLYSGYITVSSHIIRNFYELRIPNEEIRSYFRMLLREIYTGRYGERKNLTALLFNDRATFYEQLNDKLLYFSYYDLVSEKDYHHFLTCALLMNEDVGPGMRYEVVSNRESGKGRPDLMVHDRKGNRSVVFELKFLPSSENDRIPLALQEAQKQGEQRRYGAELAGNVELVPIVGCGKAFYV